MNPVIFLVDMQSFYASIEQSLRPETQNQPLVVAGDPERRSGIILAACPLAKACGVKTAQPLWEAQQACPNLVIVRPRMSLYLDISLQITAILEKFSDLVEPYSIDEQFISIHGSEKLFGTPLQIAQKIQQAITSKLGLNARIGIGSNKVLSKMACDHFAKKNKTGIFYLHTQDIPNRLWPLPIESLFGVGKRMAKHLRQMGIRTIGGLAQFPLERLQRRWGINGHVLWLSANGIDPSPVRTNSFDLQKGIGHHMTLPRDYRDAEEIQVVLLELCEEVCRRARTHHQMGQTVHVGCRGIDFSAPTGFQRQLKMTEATNQTMMLFQYAWAVFQRFWDREPIRSIGVQMSQLVSDAHVQLNLFTDERTHRLGYVMDEIKQRYGSSAILRASSLLQAGQARERAQKIGGHYR
ncbi:DNA polymerase IV [Hazenella sp. IB182357]|uniref:DNA polymerase IV n=2 Tax=Polycladospora coralii TaxID=2771432 RepID=A0A926RY30_9BACL|nr:DNA polymerase IV [Polycladospora coralii]MBD1373111.1 DNA polymerase IV [Polycladospora coralii]MBS7531669.1 DNA polymerase IV [Polycladospora coralii]